MSSAPATIHCFLGMNFADLTAKTKTQLYNSFIHGELE